MNGYSKGCVIRAIMYLNQRDPDPCFLCGFKHSRVQVKPDKALIRVLIYD